MAAWIFQSEMVMLTLYKSLVRSKLEYCCLEWDPSKVGDVWRTEVFSGLHAEDCWLHGTYLSRETEEAKAFVLAKTPRVLSYDQKWTVDFWLMTLRSSLRTT